MCWLSRSAFKPVAVVAGFLLLPVPTESGPREDRTSEVVVNAHVCGESAQKRLDCSAVSADEVWDIGQSDSPPLEPGRAVRIGSAALSKTGLAEGEPLVDSIRFLHCATGWVYSISYSWFSDCGEDPVPAPAETTVIILMTGEVIQPFNR